MNIVFSGVMWGNYIYWQTEDTKTLRKINSLVDDIKSNGVNKGIGKPERLKHIKSWSRHIDEKNRLIYDILDGTLWLYNCRGHYGDK